ncbi:protein LNK2 [Brachypodium distachyon]|uniref:Uncharacterized protein n=1 Tax=Brachypodium distachyon TaxID=15368 RepID=A0A2K2D5Q5_BRADI|nr:protein LNK2 [Brachypodium distachyon]PNT69609.1 hypothetical protein BRADI_3g58820v3 [Brachypodium distachyon]|eukprot:XP_010236904.2 protein LNK2 [Brachypodium distachyon]
MHASMGRRRRGFEPRDETTHFVMEDFAPSNDGTMLVHGRGKSKMYPAGFSTNSTPIQSRSVEEPCGNGNFVHKNDITVLPMSAEAGLFSADGYAGTSGVSDVCSSEEGSTARPQDEHGNKGDDLFLLDWPELGSLEDFETDLRKFDTTFELDSGSNYFDDPMWPSICSPDVQLVPRSRFDSPNSSAVANETATNPISKPTVSVPDTTDQINMADPLKTQQPSMNKRRDGLPTNRSASVETGRHFAPPRHAEDGLSICAPDLVILGSTKKKKPDAMAPDMILDEMAGNPLEMYFPPLTTYEQLPEDPPRSAAMALEAVAAAPVKHLGFQKLQEGMNQLDVGTKTCIRDALYRLAHSVEQTHCVGQQQLTGGGIVGSSGPNRFGKGIRTETQASPMDRSVAQLLLQKPPLNRKTSSQANHVT